MFVLGTLSSCLASAAAACACSVCTCASREAMIRSARMAWSFLFTLSMLLAWVLRDFAKPLLTKIPWIVKSFNKGEMPSDEWFGAQAVYRVSLGNWLLFTILALVMAGVRRTSDKRDRQIHHGSWVIKAGLWLVAMMFPFFLPPSVITAYSWLARLGSPLFLLVQLVILVDMTQSWNDTWVAAGDEDETWLYGLLAATIAAAAGSVGLAALGLRWFVPGDQDCGLNVFFVCSGLALAFVLALATLHPAVQGGSLFVAATVGLYVSYLGWSAMQSEPREYACNLLGARLGAASGVALAAGMLFTLLSVVYSAFRAGSNTQTFAVDWELGAAGSPLLPDAELTSAGLDGVAAAAPLGVDAMDRGNPAPRRAATKNSDAVAVDDDAPVPYSYGQFYGVFALASMYIAMLMTGWGAAGQPRDRLDVGWTSVWVKIVTQWSAAALYLWTLAAPLLFPDRVFH